VNIEEFRTILLEANKTLKKPEVVFKKFAMDLWKDYKNLSSEELIEYLDIKKKIHAREECCHLGVDDWFTLVVSFNN